VLTYYARLIRYAARTDARLFHILWNNKFESFDRTLLMLFYRWRGKKIVLTVHNVNAGQRDATDSMLNRATLRAQYRLTNHFFVHTEKMKRALRDEFGVGERDVTVIPFGINNAVPETALTAADARQRLGLGAHERVLLFFGNIAPYKGLADLVAAFRQVVSRHPDVRLVIAGRAKAGFETYAADVRRAIASTIPPGRVIEHLAYVPDEDTEIYFKAADVLVLPYTQVFQSGVLFLGYRFGLPVIATDVGSFRDDVVDGRTGFVCRPRDPDDLARIIETYFSSDLFKNLNARRLEIQERARARHSWDVVVEITRDVYGRVLGTS